MSSGPQIVETGSDWHVTCDEHALSRIVGTESHARNLIALHLRVDHHAVDIETIIAVDLTAAAVVRAGAQVENPGPWEAGYRAGAAAVWEALTALGPADALAYAQEIAGGDPLTLVTAHIPPC